MPLLIHDKPHLSEIEPGLFIGDFTSSSQLSTLRDNGITAIVSLANNISEEWSRPANRDLVPEDCHMFVCCADSPSQDILIQLPDICDFIDKHSAKLGTGPDSEHRGAQQSNVLVHCTAGVSRSATIVVAYLMRKHRESLGTVLKQVKEKRRIEPSNNFMDQLDIWEQVGYELWEDAERKTPKEPYRDFLEGKEEMAKAKAKHHAQRANHTHQNAMMLDNAPTPEGSRNYTVMYARHHAQQH
jgi:hypothetical protein